MMFSDTPMVDQLRSPSVESIRTRVTAPVPDDGVEHADLEVGQMQPGQLRVGRADRLAQRGVEGVDRAVALGGGEHALVADVDLDGRLVVTVAVRPLFGDHPEGLQREERLLPARRGAQQQLERTVGDLEVVAAVLEVLELLEHVGQRGRVELQAELVRLHLQGGLAGQLAHHEAGAVADGVGRDVLVGVGPAGDGADVQAGLVGERRAPTKGGCGSGATLTSSAMWWPTAVRRSRRSAGMVATPSLRERLGMIVVRSALPVRSP